MSDQRYSVAFRLSRLERELFFWRILGLIAVVCLMLAFHSSGPDKEVRFVSADGRQAVVLSADGLSLLAKDKTLARLNFAPVGDSENLEAELMSTGGLSVRGLSIRSGKKVALLNADHINFLQGSAIELLCPTTAFPFQIRKTAPRSL